MSTPQQRIRDFYGFDFPEDFFRFRDFLARVPAENLGEVCDMFLGSPFAVAEGNPSFHYRDHPLWDDRCYNDLPEFVTVFHGTSDGLHWGYFFDAPGDLPPVVAYYWHRESFQHSLDADSLFESVRWQVERSEMDSLDMAEYSAEDAEDSRKRMEMGKAIRTTLADFWGADRPETGEAYLDTYDYTGWRKPVAPTHSQLGIVVPATFYRPLSNYPPGSPRVDSALLDEARQMLTEGAPGAALQLGHNLWCVANQWPECYDLLEAAYTALDRGPLIHLMREARAFRAYCDSQRR
jgi:hypothetical protein